MFFFGGGRDGAFRRRLRVYSCSMLAVEKPELAASASPRRFAAARARLLARAPPRPPTLAASQRWSSPTR